MWYVIAARNKGGNAREALSKLCVYKGPLKGFSMQEWLHADRRDKNHVCFCDHSAMNSKKGGNDREALKGWPSSCLVCAWNTAAVERGGSEPRGSSTAVIFIPWGRTYFGPQSLVLHDPGQAEDSSLITHAHSVRSNCVMCVRCGKP